jgi:hypothetical protein
MIRASPWEIGIEGSKWLELLVLASGLALDAVPAAANRCGIHCSQTGLRERQGSA